MSCSVWQSQSAEAPRISLDFLHHHAAKKRRTLKNERVIFYLFAAGNLIWLLAPVFKHGLAIGTPLDIVFGVSALLFLLVVGLMALHMHKHIRMKSPAPDAGIVGGLAVYRSELERLLQAGRREWQVLLYLAPSYFTLLIGGLVFDQRPGKAMRYGLLVVAGVVTVCFTLWVGRKQVRCLQRDLDALDSLK